LLPSSQKYGIGIRKKFIPDPDEGVKKALEPGSATMLFFKNLSQQKRIQVFLNHRIVTKLSKIWNWDPGKTLPGSG
jgi:hypothetical protein